MSQAEELKGLKFYTVESIANCNDQQLQRIGMGGTVLGGLTAPRIAKATNLTVPFIVAIGLIGVTLALFVLFEPRGLYGRWLKIRGFLDTFPLYRRDTFRRGKTYMRSERYK